MAEILIMENIIEELFQKDLPRYEFLVRLLEFPKNLKEDNQIALIIRGNNARINLIKSFIFNIIRSMRKVQTVKKQQEEDFIKCLVIREYPKYNKNQIRILLIIDENDKQPNFFIEPINVNPNKVLDLPPRKLICDFCGFPLDPNDPLVIDYAKVMKKEFKAVFRCNHGNNLNFRYHDFHFPAEMNKCQYCNNTHDKMAKLDLGEL